MRARTLYLYGKLGKELGRKHTVYVDSVAEAMRYLAANFGEKFYANMKEGYYKIKKVTKDKTSFINEKGLCFNLGEGDLYLIPVTRGAANVRAKQVGMIVAAVALTVVTYGAGAGWFGTAAASTFASGSYAAAAGYSLAASLALQGIAGLLTPIPKTEEQQGEVARNEGTSSGILNTSKEGSTIPVIYGKVKVGSVVISSGVYAEQMTTNSQYSVVMGYLNEYINRVADLLSAYDVAINTTDASQDTVANTGGYSYYPGKYPYIKTNIQDYRNTFASLLDTAYTLRQQSVNTMSITAYEDLVDTTLSRCTEILPVLETLYDSVGEVCDFYVVSNPYRADKRATAIASGVLVTALQVNEPVMRYYRKKQSWVQMHTIPTYLGYFATTKANNTFRSSATMTPLDRCYYMTNVLNYVLKELKAKESW